MKIERKEKSFKVEYKTNPVRPELVEGQYQTTPVRTELVEGQTASAHGSTSSPRTDGEGSQ
jgi:hypothetical protein